MVEVYQTESALPADQSPTATTTIIDRSSASSLMEPSLSSEAAVAVVPTVDVHAAKELVAAGHKYLDVRTVEEFEKGHLEKSLNVPYVFFTPQGREKNPEFVEQVSAICDREDHIVVGCRSGVRSLDAAAALINAGFKDVKNMGGGYVAWVEKGFDVNVVSKGTCSEAASSCRLSTCMRQRGSSVLITSI